MEEIVKKEENKEVILSPEEKVVLVACKNAKLLKSITASAKRQEVEVVRLDEKVIDDYLKIKKDKKENTNVSSNLEAFLSNVKNQTTAEEQARKLWTILTRKTKVEECEKFIFSQKQVVHDTSLSNSKAIQLFDLLHAFGYFEWVDVKKRMFKLHFDDSFIEKSIKNDILSVSKAVSMDIIRYKKYLKSHCFDKEEELIQDLKTNTLSVLNF